MIDHPRDPASRTHRSAIPGARARTEDGTSDAPSLHDQVQHLEDAVSRGLPRLEQELMRLEAELPERLREHARDLPIWTNSRLDDVLVPLRRSVRRARESSARAFRRLSDLDTSCTEMRERITSLAESQQSDDPRLVRTDERLARQVRSVDELRATLEQSLQLFDRELKGERTRAREHDAATDGTLARLTQHMDQVEQSARQTFEAHVAEWTQKAARLAEGLTDVETRLDVELETVRGDLRRSWADERARADRLRSEALNASETRQLKAHETMDKRLELAAPMAEVQSMRAIFEDRAQRDDARSTEWAERVDDFRQRLAQIELRCDTRVEVARRQSLWWRSAAVLAWAAWLAYWLIVVR